MRFFFHELIRLARTYTMLDDLEHYQTTRMNPISRRAALALGKRLQERNILDQPEDVFFFHKADLEELVTAFPYEAAADFRAAPTGRSSPTNRAATRPRPGRWARRRPRLRAWAGTRSAAYRAVRVK